MTKERLEKICKEIETEVLSLHEGLHLQKRGWNPVAGQWLVYGFERVLGFSGGASLCAAVETAYRKKQSLSQAAFDCIKEMYVENGQWEETKE